MTETGKGTQEMDPEKVMIAVVIPSFRVTHHILDVLARIGPEVGRIYVVDDRCPDGSGRLVQDKCADPRVKVLFNDINLGVGGATMAGYLAAKEDGARVMVKVDGDGQMDPAEIMRFAGPILRGEADYTKGNRFFYLEGLQGMPPLRLVGNAGLSFFSKLSTGYWDIFDPTNGYTAIHADVMAELPMDKISQRYFFESDMLFRLGTIRAVVADIPMHSHYADEVSGLQVGKVAKEFFIKHMANFGKRIFYNYILRNFSPATLELLAGLPLMAFGTVFGSYEWAANASRNVATPAGAVMLAGLPILVGIQLILAFFSYDMSMVPRTAIHTRLRAG